MRVRSSEERRSLGSEVWTMKLFIASVVILGLIMWMEVSLLPREWVACIVLAIANYRLGGFAYDLAKRLTR